VKGLFEIEFPVRLYKIVTDKDIENTLNGMYAFLCKKNNETFKVKEIRIKSPIKTELQNR